MVATVAFDVDETIITWSLDGGAVPNHNVIDLLRWFVTNQHDVVVWSGGGVQYAQRWVEKLGLAASVRVVEKGSIPVDIAVDDMGGADETARYYEAQTLKNAKVTIVV